MQRYGGRRHFDLLIKKPKLLVRDVLFVCTGSLVVAFGEQARVGGALVA